MPRKNGDLRGSGNDDRQECEAGDVYQKNARCTDRPFRMLDCSPLPCPAAALAVAYLAVALGELAGVMERLQAG